MANSNGIIKAPVGLHEVYSVLGVSMDTFADVGYICRNSHGKIRPMSIKKPTRKDGLDPSDPQTGNVNDDFYAGFDTYGIVKPHVQLPDASTVQTTGNKLNYNISNLVPTSVSGSSFVVGGGNYWTYAPPTSSDWCRLADFNGYSHNTHLYAKSGEEYPFKVSGLNLLQQGSSTVSVAAQLMIDWSDHIADSSVGAGSLGLCKLLGVENISNVSWYFGVFLYAPMKNGIAGITTNRTVPLCMYAIGTTPLSGGNGNTGTAGYYTINSGTFANAIGGTASSPQSDKLYPNEKVAVGGFLARKLSSGMWSAIGLNTPRKNGCAIFTVGENVTAGADRVDIGSVQVTLTMRKTSDYIDFFISVNTDMRITAKATGNGSRFVSMFGGVMISPYGAGLNRLAGNDGSWGNGGDDEVRGASKVMVPNGGTVISMSYFSGWRNTYPYCPWLRISRPSSSFQVSVSLSWWYQTTKYAVGYVTVNPSTGNNDENIKLSAVTLS